MGIFGVHIRLTLLRIHHQSLRVQVYGDGWLLVALLKMPCPVDQGIRKI